MPEYPTLVWERTVAPPIGVWVMKGFALTTKVEYLAVKSVHDTKPLIVDLPVLTAKSVHDTKPLIVDLPVLTAKSVHDAKALSVDITYTYTVKVTGP